MRASIIIPVLLGAGAIAHPRFKLNNPLAHLHHKRQAPAEVKTIVENGEVEIEDIFVTTIYEDGANVPAATPTSTPPPASSSPAPVAAQEKLAVPQGQQGQQGWQGQQGTYNQNSGSGSQQPPAAPAAPAAPAPVQSSAAPAPVQSSTSSSNSNDGAPTSGGKSILESANDFRTSFGLGTWTYSSTLGGNSAKTNHDDGADSMTHELNAGSFAQCIAEGDDTTAAGGYTPFELILLGWNCELPDARLGNGCNVMESATHMSINYSDPGHAQILRTPTYTQMGCNYQDATESQSYKGLWTCDFA